MTGTTKKETKPSNAACAECPTAQPHPFRQRIIFVSGDKGGVGKSTKTQALSNNLRDRGYSIAVIDTDTRNPDVIRMFEGVVPTAGINLRKEDGWMDVIDFITSHPDKHILVSLPAGIGESMCQGMEFKEFCMFFDKKYSDETRPELVLVWVINLFIDSVNLLSKTMTAIGDKFQKVVVVRNLVFSDNNPDLFQLWNESPLKKDLESKGRGITVDLPALHLRTMTRLFHEPEDLMPFSEALKQDEIFQFSKAEAFKLEAWIHHVDDGVAKIRDFVGLEN
ncbi:P-loop NTPase [Chromobacterium vaccinii]|uniref:P-loop NTPase n=1 Tax=Chromobacterium vaccinii TaxID=1108595 RepID=UPI003C77D4B7